MGGVKLLQRYPVIFTNDSVIFNDPLVFPQQVKVIDLILENIFGLSFIRFCCLMIFCGILVMLKCYHLYFKCRPATAYSKYGNLVSTSTSSIQSENS